VELAAANLIRSHALYPVVLVLVIGSRFNQNRHSFPFHFWLPHANGGAPPVSGLSALCDRWSQGRGISAGAFLTAGYPTPTCGSSLVSITGMITLLLVLHRRVQA